MWQCMGNKKNLVPIKGTRSSFVLPPNFMSGSLQNTLSGTPAIALIPYLYNGSSRAASSFSMPGSEAIFHGFVCAPSHQVELSLPASFMYSSLHCLYEVEANIHPQRICVKSFLFNMGRKVWGLRSGSKDPMEPAGREGRICLPWQQRDASYALLHFIAMPSRSPQELWHAASRISFL